jgi:chromate transporter
MLEKNRLLEIAKLFFKLGCISFGGPAAHIAMMEDEVVKKRKWLTQEHFLDLIGATNLIPGPNSTEMTMHCGYEQGGWKGLFIAGICFITPAILITMLFAWLYEIYGQLPTVKPFIYGIKPAVISLIIMAGYKLGKKAVKNTELAFLGILTMIACYIGINEVTALFCTGILGVSIYYIKNKKTKFNSFTITPLILFTNILKIGSFKILSVFFKVGAILYGSGYVLFAFLDSELVSKELLSKQALIDAIAVGQFTPGPVLSTATFIGWQMNGVSGAIAATLGIFLPSFLFVLLLNPLIPRMRKSKVISAFLDAVNVAAVALIILVCFNMGKDTLTDWRSIFIAIISCIVVFYFKKINSAFIVLGGAISGYFLNFV